MYVNIDKLADFPSISKPNICQVPTSFLSLPLQLIPMVFTSVKWFSFFHTILIFCLPHFMQHIFIQKFPCLVEFWKEKAETDCWDMANITLEKSRNINDDICYCSTCLLYGTSILISSSSFLFPFSVDFFLFTFHP